MLVLCNHVGKIRSRYPVTTQPNYRPSPKDYDAALTTFIRNCKVRNLTELTITYCRDVIVCSSVYWPLRGVLGPIDVMHEIFTKYHRKRERAPFDAAVDKYLRGWRAFFNVMATEGYVPTNPFDKVAKIKSESRIIGTFSKTQMRALLEAPNKNTFTGYRDYVLMLTLLDTMCTRGRQNER